MGTSPAPLKANGSSRSSGRFKLGGVRPARTGTLTPTQMGAWAGAQGSTCARRAGPGSVAALSTRPGAASSRGPAVSEGGSHRGGPSHVPTAGPVLGSTALLLWIGERSGGALRVPLRPWLPATGALSCWAPGPGLDPVLPQPRPRRQPLTRVHAPPGPEPRPVGLTAGSSGHSGPSHG